MRMNTSELCFLVVLFYCEVPQSLKDHRGISMVLLFCLHFVVCISWGCELVSFSCLYLNSAGLLCVLFSTILMNRLRRQQEKGQ